MNKCDKEQFTVKIILHNNYLPPMTNNYTTIYFCSIANKNNIIINQGV